MNFKKIFKISVTSFKTQFKIKDNKLCNTVSTVLKKILILPVPSKCWSFIE